MSTDPYYFHRPHNLNSMNDDPEELAALDDVIGDVRGIQPSLPVEEPLLPGVVLAGDDVIHAAHFQKLFDAGVFTSDPLPRFRLPNPSLVDNDDLFRHTQITGEVYPD